MNGYARIDRVSNYTKSVLLPFLTKPIKPFYDYPLNTSVLETTLELNVNLVAANGTGVTGSSGFGCAMAIMPHAFNAWAPNTDDTGNARNVNLINIFA